MQAMENATEKSAQTRTTALQSICEILMQRYMPEFVDERKITIMDLLEKGIKRGKGPEQAHSARLAALLIIQIGADEEIIKQLTPLLLTTALDPAANLEARAKVSLSQFCMGVLAARFSYCDPLPAWQLFSNANTESKHTNTRMITILLLV